MNTAHHNLYTVGMSAVSVSPDKTHGGLDVTVQNSNSSGYVYVGGEGVSASNYGYRILPNHAISFEVPSHSVIYVIASQPNMKVAVITMPLEIGA